MKLLKPLVAIGLAATTITALSLWRSAPRPPATTTAQGIRPDTYDNFGRLIGFTGRLDQDCPAQGPRTAVLVLAGQSNWGNLGGQRVASHHPDQVVSYFNGRCGPAQSPLLGTSEGRGNSGPLLADRLIDSGQFDSVVLVPAAISASTIDRWRQGGDLNPLLVQAVRDVKSRYKITHVLWHQGESDYRRTKQEDYARGFASVVTSLRAEGVEAPILAAVTTKCLYTVDFDPNDPVALAQRALPDPSQKIFAGPDTDALVLDEDRYDGCHFGASGMEKFANAWAEAIAAVK